MLDRAVDTAFRLLAIVVMLSTAALAGPETGVPCEVPPELRGLIMGWRTRPLVELRIGGEPFYGMTLASETPYLLWPSAESQSVPRDRERAGEWIRGAADALGHAGFEPFFREVASWQRNQVWVYGLRLAGLEIFDASVRIYWDGDRFLGIANHVPMPIHRMETVAAIQPSGQERVYAAVREGSGHALVVASVERSSGPARSEVVLAYAGRRIRHIVTPRIRQNLSSASIREWAVPTGPYPDQIDIDSTGLVWFSQSGDLVTSFDSSTALFSSYPTTGGQLPDGMFIDRSDRLWVGMYNADDGLGQFDIALLQFTTHALAYAGAILAVPTGNNSGTMWVTDHISNRISEFDPTGSGWVQSLPMLQPDAWVVAGTEDPLSGDVYFTEYAIDSLGRKIFGGGLEDIAVPAGSGPAFAAYWDGKIYFSEWTSDRLGEYDIAARTITEYVLPIAEYGGPIDATPDGLIALGTRDRGYIMLFDPVVANFEVVTIPTPYAGLKDGLRAGLGGQIWFTETFTDRIAVVDRCVSVMPSPLGNALRVLKEAGATRLVWSDDPLADGHAAGSSEQRDFSPPIAVLGTGLRGNPGVADSAPLGSSMIRSYRIATEVCGSRSSW